jgi:nicotinate-nucleotide adenylyltransferase
MDQQRRIGIYGGTFDPIHRGHLEVAKQTAQLLGLEEVIFLPALQAPHKLERSVTSRLHRYAMLILATVNDSGLKVSTFELEAEDRRYTVDTVAHFQKEFAGTAQLFFIMGADSWSEITSWKNWERLLTITHHVVVTRPGVDLSIDHVGSDVRRRIVDLRSSSNPVDAAAEATPGAGRIFLSDAVMVDVSATDIRRAAADKRFSELEQWVPATVAQYIRKYGLYRDFA